MFIFKDVKILLARLFASILMVILGLALFYQLLFNDMLMYDVKLILMLGNP